MKNLSDKINESLNENESIFFAFYNSKKIEITGKDLYDAKQKAIKELKIPKSKQGLLSVVSKKSQENQDFRFL